MTFSMGMKPPIFHSVVEYIIFKLSRRLQCPPLEGRTTLILLQITDQRTFEDDGDLCELAPSSLELSMTVP